MANLGTRQGKWCGLVQQSRGELTLGMDRTEAARRCDEVAGASKVDLGVPGSREVDGLELWSLKWGCSIHRIG